MQDVPLSVACLLSVLCVASIVVLSLAVIRLWHGHSILPPIDKPLPQLQWTSTILVVAWVGMQLLSLAVVTPQESLALTIESVQGDCLFKTLLFLAVLVPMTYQGAPDLEEFGFHLQNWKRQVSEGILGFCGAVAPVMAAWLLTLSWRTDSNQHGLLQLLVMDRSWEALLWIILAAVILAPLVEELIYRVILQTWLEQLAPPREALVGVAVIFSAVHRLPDAIPLIPLALVLGYVYQQRRCFLTVVLIHMLFNATNLTLALLSLPAP